MDRPTFGQLVTKVAFCPECFMGNPAAQCQKCEGHEGDHTFNTRKPKGSGAMISWSGHWERRK